MEVDALSKGKGKKGKKDKGKGKGKEKTSGKESGNGAAAPKESRECFYCGNTGHIARNCHKRLEDERARGKGAHGGGDKASVQKARVAAIEARWAAAAKANEAMASMGVSPAASSEQPVVQGQALPPPWNPELAVVYAQLAV